MAAYFFILLPRRVRQRPQARPAELVAPRRAVPEGRPPPRLGNNPDPPRSTATALAPSVVANRIRANLTIAGRSGVGGPSRPKTREFVRSLLRGSRGSRMTSGRCLMRNSSGVRLAPPFHESDHTYRLTVTRAFILHSASLRVCWL